MFWNFTLYARFALTSLNIAQKEELKEFDGCVKQKPSPQHSLEAEFQCNTLKDSQAELINFFDKNAQKLEDSGHSVLRDESFESTQKKEAILCGLNSSETVNDVYLETTDVPRIDTKESDASISVGDDHEILNPSKSLGDDLEILNDFISSGHDLEILNDFISKTPLSEIQNSLGDPGDNFEILIASIVKTFSNGQISDISDQIGLSDAQQEVDLNPTLINIPKNPILPGIPTDIIASELNYESRTDFREKTLFQRFSKHGQESQISEIEVLLNLSDDVTGVEPLRTYNTTIELSKESGDHPNQPTESPTTHGCHNPIHSSSENSNIPSTDGISSQNNTQKTAFDSFNAPEAHYETNSHKILNSFHAPEAPYQTNPHKILDSSPENLITFSNSSESLNNQTKIDTHHTVSGENPENQKMKSTCVSHCEHTKYSDEPFHQKFLTDFTAIETNQERASGNDSKCSNQNHLDQSRSSMKVHTTEDDIPIAILCSFLEDNKPLSSEYFQKSGKMSAYVFDLDIKTLTSSATPNLQKENESVFQTRPSTNSFQNTQDQSNSSEISLGSDFDNQKDISEELKDFEEIFRREMSINHEHAEQSDDTYSVLSILDTENQLSEQVNYLTETKKGESEIDPSYSSLTDLDLENQLSEQVNYLTETKKGESEIDPSYSSLTDFNPEIQLSEQVNYLTETKKGESEIDPSYSSLTDFNPEIQLSEQVNYLTETKKGESQMDRSSSSLTDLDLENQLSEQANPLTKTEKGESQMDRPSSSVSTSKMEVPLFNQTEFLTETEKGGSSIVSQTSHLKTKKSDKTPTYRLRSQKNTIEPKNGPNSYRKALKRQHSSNNLTEPSIPTKKSLSISYQKCSSKIYFLNKKPTSNSNQSTNHLIDKDETNQIQSLTRENDKTIQSLDFILSTVPQINNYSDYSFRLALEDSQEVTNTPRYRFYFDCSGKDAIDHLKTLLIYPTKKQNDLTEFMNLFTIKSFTNFNGQIDIDFHCSDGDITKFDEFMSKTVESLESEFKTAKFKSINYKWAGDECIRINRDSREICSLDCIPDPLKDFNDEIMPHLQKLHLNSKFSELCMVFIDIIRIASRFNNILSQIAILKIHKSGFFRCKNSSCVVNDSMERIINYRRPKNTIRKNHSCCIYYGIQSRNISPKVITRVLIHCIFKSYFDHLMSINKNTKKLWKKEISTKHALLLRIIFTKNFPYKTVARYFDRNSILANRIEKMIRSENISLSSSS